MEKNINVKATEKKVKLVDGEFTPDKALEILTALINQKINFHKFEITQLWEQNHKVNQEPFWMRIQELEDEKNDLRNYISEFRHEDKKLKITGILTIQDIY